MFRHTFTIEDDKNVLKIVNKEFDSNLSEFNTINCMNAVLNSNMSYRSNDDINYYCILNGNEYNYMIRFKHIQNYEKLLIKYISIRNMYFIPRLNSHFGKRLLSTIEFNNNILEFNLNSSSFKEDSDMHIDICYTINNSKIVVNKLITENIIDAKNLW